MYTYDSLYSPSAYAADAYASPKHASYLNGYQYSDYSNSEYTYLKADTEDLYKNKESYAYCSDYEYAAYNSYALYSYANPKSENVASISEMASLVVGISLLKALTGAFKKWMAKN